MLMVFEKLLFDFDSFDEEISGLLYGPAVVPVVLRAFVNGFKAILQVLSERPNELLVELVVH